MTLSSSRTNLASADWANPVEFAESHHFDDNAGQVWMGRSPVDNTAVGFDDNRHVCLVGGTRGGKGTSVILPNICSWPGSLVVIDPKGENATVAAARRGEGSDYCEGMKQDVHILDPFSIVVGNETYKSHFNPLDALDPKHPEVIDHAALIADAIIIVREDSKDPFWEESARAMVKALILHLLTSDMFKGRRNLITLREFIVRGDWKGVQALKDLDYKKIPSSQQLLWQGVLNNQALGGVISGAGDTYMSMLESNPKGFDGVRQTAITNTEFLDSPGMRECLRSSDFKLSDLKTRANGVSLFLSLPQRYMPTHFRWLRMMVSLITAEMEAVKQRPATGHSLLMLLDEFAGLERMKSIENAVAQIAGYGVKLFFVLQSLEQLKGTYQNHWETFLANAGVKIFFGINDQFTRNYVSQMLGETEVRRDTSTSSNTTGTNTSESEGTSESITEGSSESKTQGRSLSDTQGESHSTSKGTSESKTIGKSESHTRGTGGSSSDSQNRGSNQSQSSGTNQGTNSSTNQSTGGSSNSNRGFSLGNGYSRTSGSGYGSNHSTGHGRGSSQGSNHSSSKGSSSGASQSRSKSWNKSFSISKNTSQTFGLNRSESHSRNYSHTSGENESFSESVNHSKTKGVTHSKTVGESASKTEGVNQNLYHRPLITPDEIGLCLCPIEDRSHPQYPGFALIVPSDGRPSAVRRCNYYEDEHYIGWYDTHPDFPENAPPKFLVDFEILGLPTSTFQESDFPVDALEKYFDTDALAVAEWFVKKGQAVQFAQPLALVGPLKLKPNVRYLKDALNQAQNDNAKLALEDSALYWNIRAPRSGKLKSPTQENKHAIGYVESNRRIQYSERELLIDTPGLSFSDYIYNLGEVIDERKEAQRLARAKQKRLREEAERQEQEENFRKAEALKLAAEEQRLIREAEEEQIRKDQEAVAEESRLAAIREKRNEKIAFYEKRIVVFVAVIFALTLVFIITDTIRDDMRRTQRLHEDEIIKAIDEADPRSRWSSPIFNYDYERSYENMPDFSDLGPGSRRERQWKYSREDEFDAAVIMRVRENRAFIRQWMMESMKVDTSHKSGGLLLDTYEFHLNASHSALEEHFGVKQLALLTFVIANLKSGMPIGYTPEQDELFYDKLAPRINPKLGHQASNIDFKNIQDDFDDDLLKGTRLEPLGALSQRDDDLMAYIFKQYPYCVIGGEENMDFSFLFYGIDFLRSAAPTGLEYGQENLEKVRKSLSDFSSDESIALTSRLIIDAIPHLDSADYKKKNYLNDVEVHLSAFLAQEELLKADGYDVGSN